MYTEIQCPNCSAIVELKNFNVERSEVTCFECQHTFAISDHVERRIRNKNVIYNPENLEYESTKNEFNVSVKLFTIPKVLLRSVFVIWILFIALLITLIIYKVFNGYLFFAIVGVLSLSSFFINIFQLKKKITSSMRCTLSNIKVTTFNHDKNANNEAREKVIDFNPSEIKQFYVIQKTVNFKPLYILKALFHDGRRKNIFDTFSLQDILFVEQELEKFYGIKDERVDEEINV